MKDNFMIQNYCDLEILGLRDPLGFPGYGILGTDPPLCLRNSGYMVNWWIPAALQKEIIETTKIDECRAWDRRLKWQLVDWSMS